MGGCCHARPALVTQSPTGNIASLWGGGTEFAELFLCNTFGWMTLISRSAGVTRLCYVNGYTGDNLPAMENQGLELSLALSEIIKASHQCKSCAL